MDARPWTPYITLLTWTYIVFSHMGVYMEQQTTMDAQIMDSVACVLERLGGFLHLCLLLGLCLGACRFLGAYNILLCTMGFIADSPGLSLGWVGQHGQPIWFLDGCWIMGYNILWICYPDYTGHLVLNNGACPLRSVLLEDA